MFAMTTQFFKGMVIEWYRPIEEIPSGWALCDGNNGTPNLLERFIIGAGNTYAVGDTGGADYHNHYFNAGGHQHVIPAGSALQSGSGFSNQTDERTPSGTTGNEPTVPPYYALAYIMKV